MTINQENMFLLELGSQDNNVFVSLGRGLGRMCEKILFVARGLKTQWASFKEEMPFFFPAEILWGFEVVNKLLSSWPCYRKENI